MAAKNQINWPDMAIGVRTSTGDGVYQPIGAGGSGPIHNEPCKKRPTIEDVVKRLDERLAVAHNLLTYLDQKMTPILTPETTTAPPAMEGCNSMECSPLYLIIDQLDGEVMTLCRRIEKLIERCQG